MKEIFEKYNFNISEELEKKFILYKSLLVEWNEYINLSAIKDDKEIILRHFLDSYSIASLIKPLTKNKKIIDMGTGAGFPGIILALLNKESEIYLIDSVYKKIQFLNEVKKNLKLENTKIYHHHLDKKNTTNIKFDVIISRAFMKPEKLIYFTKNYMKNSSKHILLLTQKQLDNFSDSIKKYKPSIMSYPFEGMKRYVLVFDKF